MFTVLIWADEIGHKVVDLGDRALRSDKTKYAFVGVAGVAGGFVLGVEMVRAAIG